MGVTWNTIQTSDMPLWESPDFHNMSYFFIFRCHNNNYNDNNNNGDDDDDDNGNDLSPFDPEVAGWVIALKWENTRGSWCQQHIPRHN